MALSDLLNSLLIEHGSSVVQEKHIALLKEEASILEKKVSVLEHDLAICSAELAELTSKFEDLQSEKDDLNALIEQIKGKKDPGGDMCPYCRHSTGQLVDLKPHSIFGDMGLKVVFYQCTNCGKKYDREHQS